MSDSHFRHYGNADAIHNTFHKAWVSHTGNTPFLTDIRRNAFKRHNGTSTRFLDYICLFFIRNVHNNAAFKHLSQTAF